MQDHLSYFCFFLLLKSYSQVKQWHRKYELFAQKLAKPPLEFLEHARTHTRDCYDGTSQLTPNKSISYINFFTEKLSGVIELWQVPKNTFLSRKN